MKADTEVDNLLETVFDTVIKMLNTVLELPIAADAMHRAGELRDLALQLQETVLGALNLPTATEVARLGTRLRSVSQRLEDIEDTLETMAAQLDSLVRTAALLHKPGSGVEPIAARIDDLAAESPVTG